jgi:hypothetical protein
MKKIIAIISSCLVAILLAVTITLACTKFTAVSVVGDGAMSIKLYKGESTETLELHQDDAEYAEIVKLQKASLKENTLSSLFQGATSFDYEVKSKEVKISEITGNKEGTYVLCYVYGETQTLKIKGEKYVNPDADTEKGESTDITYKVLYVEVKNSANYTEYNVYLANKATDTKSYHYVKLIAQQSDLYKYVGDLKYVW